MQRREHLPGKSRGDFGLRLAALGQERRQLGLGVAAEERVRRQEHVECGQDGPACRQRHLRELEGYIPRRLALRRVDQTDALMRAEQPDRNAGLPQQPFESGVTSGIPPCAVVGRLVEIGAAVLDSDEHRPFTVRVFVARHGPGGREHDL